MMLRKILRDEERCIIEQNPWQRHRQMKIKENGTFLVNNNLRSGVLQVFEIMGNVATLQDLYYRKSEDVAIVAEIIVNDLFTEKKMPPIGDEVAYEDDKLFIHKIRCEMGYESIADELVKELILFAKDYGYAEVVLLKNEYQKWQGVSQKLERFKDWEDGTYRLLVKGELLDG